MSVGLRSTAAQYRSGPLGIRRPFFTATIRHSPVPRHRRRNVAIWQAAVVPILPRFVRRRFPDNREIIWEFKKMRCAAQHGSKRPIDVARICAPMMRNSVFAGSIYGLHSLIGQKHYRTIPTKVKA